jgi:hypothetical protein
MGRCPSSEILVVFAITALLNIDVSISVRGAAGGRGAWN